MEKIPNKLFIYQIWPNIPKDEVMNIYSMIFFTFQLVNIQQKSNTSIDTIVAWFHNIKGHNLETPAEVRMLMALIEDVGKLKDIHDLKDILLFSDEEFNKFFPIRETT